ncbi:EXTL3 [Mytilus coruscus]|uniref:EXTL3 n=1 Tax=Mytilus coruscus TaxID=42192 RepID=A0A6J8C145_MYTCO|nr:EXTL3 [Mytilus coruscus]
MTFITPEENSMNNRFNVSKYLHTDAVLIVDDDVLLNEALISLMLYRWLENTDRLLGLDGRFVHSGYQYSGYSHGHNSSLVIGKTMLFHRKYLEQYMNDKVLVEWNQPRFCEDISMNALFFNATKLKPLLVQMNDYCYRTNLPEVDGLSISIPANRWIHKRSKCVQWVSEYFNITF